MIGECGIYKITNLVNGKFYIGASVNIQRRFKEHRVKSKSRGCKVLSRALRKYGVTNFKFDTVELCDRDQLVKKEMLWIKKLNPEYNASLGPGRLGIPTSQTQKDLLSKSGKLQWKLMSEASKQRVINHQLCRPKKGHAVLESTRIKISKALKGVPLKQSTKKKIGAANSLSMVGNKNGNKPVYQYDIHGRLVGEFDSILIASIATSIHPSSITKQLKGVQKTAGGFTWKLKQT